MTEETLREADADPFRSRLGRRKVLTIAWVFGLIALLASLFAWGLQRDPRLIRSVLVGRPAPDFSLPAIEGDREVRLSDLRGQVVVLNFWASWCTACTLEHPNFVAAWDRYRDRGVVFLGVLFQDSPDAAMKYMAEVGGDWPQLLDPGARTAQAYGVYGVPETFLIGPDGLIAYKRVGFTSYDILVQQIERLLAKGGDA